MEFLKYLDVLIGLTLVMILLSPAVTAITQLFMFVFNSRSKFLRKGLTALIGQLDAAPVEQFEVRDTTGAVVTPAPIISVVSRTAGTLVIEVKDAAQNPLIGHTVSLNLIPRGAQVGERFESGATGQNGIATVTYLHAGSVAYTGNTAVVSVLDASGAVVNAATVACRIRTGPNANTNVPVPGGTFTYPPMTRPAPVQYEIECTVTGAAGAALQNHKVRFDFVRNNSFDETLTAVTAAPKGRASFNLPAALGVEAAGVLADAVLRHPIICKANLGLGWLKRGYEWQFTQRWPGLADKLKKLDTWISRDPAGEIVLRDELTCILLELAAGEGSGKLENETVQKALTECLKRSGVPDPSKALSDIRSESQRLEKDKPDVAAHTRMAEAIIAGAKSDYVGRINAWFDQTMDRITQRYGTRARLVTILGALLVAFAIQVDSLDLLRRLSVDDKLRSSLLDEAKTQQSRIDNLSKAPAKENQDELESAKASRDEINQNLSKLRAPQMAILPDHFIWQQVPQARLDRNPTWKPPYPSKFELVLGSTSYTVSPRWRHDPLVDLKEAIDESEIPISTNIEPGQAAFLLTAKNAGAVDLIDAGGNRLLIPVVELSRAKLVFNPDWPDKINSKLCFVVEDHKRQEIALSTEKKGEIIPKLSEALKANDDVAVWSNDSELRITALDPHVNNIELLYDCHDPFSNMLNNTERITHSGTIQSSVSQQNPTLQSDKGTTKVANVANLKETDSVAVKPYRADSLVLTSHRLGGLELRYTAGKPETNVLNKPVKTNWATMAWLLQPSAWGIVLSWLLLSLGAPFWYDMLKDLLKLRSALAGKEEAQRKDRQADTKPANAPQ
jgi:hypothetical protein